MGSTSSVLGCKKYANAVVMIGMVEMACRANFWAIIRSASRHVHLWSCPRDQVHHANASINRFQNDVQARSQHLLQMMCTISSSSMQSGWMLR